MWVVSKGRRWRCRPGLAGIGGKVPSGGQGGVGGWEALDEWKGWEKGGGKY